ncbi:Fc.00g026720.m01.CDS01 [Cosmosporella sp. VM-42]
MSFCDFCTNLTVSQLDDNDILFKPNLNALRLSATAGCSYCILCFTRIQEDWSTKYVSALLNGDIPEGYTGDVWYPNLWLRGQFARGRSGYGAGMEEGCCIWLSCGKMQSFEGEEGSNKTGLGLVARLAIYATDGSPAASRFRERFSSVSNDPQLHIGMIRTCLERCRASHRLCTTQGMAEMPTRVIDVGDPAEGYPLRLLITDGLRKPYLALSYCWGPGQDTFTLKKGTKGGMLRGIAAAQLAKTHQDAIGLARSLGVRYVWIDALCIVQGDADDWTYESRRMAQVYGNATLTVIAGRSDDARLGFVTSNLHQSAEPCPIPLAPSSKDALYAALPRSRKIGPVDTRGWCFQEKTLSRRAIVFGEEQLIFQCRTRSEFEDGYMVYEDIRPTFLTPSHTPTSEEELTVEKEKTLKMWYSILNQFTLRDLSNPHDIFAGVVSVAKLAGDVLRSRYLAGLWESDIVRGLLWKPRHHVQLTFNGPITRPQPTRFAPPPVIRAPSWSWASVEGPVLQKYNERQSAQYQNASFVRIRPTLGDRWSADEGCDVSALHMPSCELQFLGRLGQASVMKEPVEEYLTTTKPWRAYSKAKMHRYGTLLKSNEDTAASTGNLETQVVAIGLFDVVEEACEEVWCILLVPTEGLMAVKDGEAWRRVGWFILEKKEWFEGKHEVGIRLV